MIEIIDNKELMNEFWEFDENLQNSLKKFVMENVSERGTEWTGRDNRCAAELTLDVKNVRITETFDWSADNAFCDLENETAARNVAIEMIAAQMAFMRLWREG